MFSEHNWFRTYTWFSEYNNNANKILIYGGLRFYQYNEDDFRLNYDLHQDSKQHGYTKKWK